jgi:nitroimidazol reductase NimA-like FMN-containing flavoprotein (pyridoxamine 5'-phosphate oxidase superfamily)
MSYSCVQFLFIATQLAAGSGLCGMILSYPYANASPDAAPDQSQTRTIAMTTFQQTDKNRVRRHPERGAYDRKSVYEIIDEALICHAAFSQDHEPFVIPTLHARHEDWILLHGASSSRLMQRLQSGRPVCLAFSLVDGLVLARSIFSHSINYRSVVLFGHGQRVDSHAEKMIALEQFTERIMPGRWADARQPTTLELKATSVARVPIELASAKIRQGPPVDDEADLALPVWAGVVPIRQSAGEPLPDPQQAGNVPLPDYIRRYLQGL